MANYVTETQETTQRLRACDAHDILKTHSFIPTLTHLHDPIVWTHLT